MSTLAAVRAALEGRLAASCRVCLAPCAAGGTALASELRLRSGVYTLRDVLARLTHTQVEDDHLLPSRLCDACLASCIAAFNLVHAYQRSAASLERCLHLLSCQLHRHCSPSHDKQLFIPVLPRLLDYDAEDAPVSLNEESDSDLEPELKQFHCTMCARSFTTELLLKQHELSHPPGTEHICRHCGRLYKQRVILNRHIASKHGGQQAFLCVACGKTYATAIGLNLHRANQHGKDQANRVDTSEVSVKKEPIDIVQDDPSGATRMNRERNVMCEICAKTFNRRVDLKKHMMNRHTPMECPECGKCFKMRSYYESHVQRHNKTREELKIHRCEYCTYATDKKFLLTCHTRRRHTHVRPYVCELCGKGFYIRREVTLHMSVHTKERPECCTVCSKRFVNKTALLFHTRLHTGERPYACPACPERFLSPSRRGAHVRSKHLPRPQCRLCRATFTDKQVLKKHIKNVHGKNGAAAAIPDDPPAPPPGDPPATTPDDPPTSPPGDPPTSPPGDPPTSPPGDPPTSPPGDPPTPPAPPYAAGTAPALSTLDIVVAM